MNRLDRPQRKALLDSDERWSATFNVGKGRITLTCVQVRKCFYYAMACCAPQDIFNRKEGKFRALRRLAEELQRPSDLHSDSYLVGCFDVAELVGVDEVHVRTSTLKAILVKHLNRHIDHMPVWVRAYHLELVAQSKTWEEFLKLPESKPKKERRRLIRYTITIKAAYEGVPVNMVDILKDNVEKAVLNARLLNTPEGHAVEVGGHFTVEVKDG